MFRVACFVCQRDVPQVAKENNFTFRYEECYQSYFYCTEIVV